MPAPDERPGWSITWLLRIQRRHRAAQARRAGMPTGFSRWFPWAVLALLLIEVAVFAWLGIVPRI